MSDDDSNIDFLAAWSYSSGESTLSVAEGRVHVLLEVRDQLRQREANGYPRLPAWQEIDDATLSRKILGSLLEAGWSPPSPEAVHAAAAKAKAEMDRSSAAMSRLTEEEQAELLAFYEANGRMPDWWPPNTEAMGGRP